MLSLAKRRNDALQMLDLYHTGFGKRVEKAMGEILEAEYGPVDDDLKTIESPPMVPGKDANARSVDENKKKTEKAPPRAAKSPEGDTREGKSREGKSPKGKSPKVVSGEVES